MKRLLLYALLPWICLTQVSFGEIAADEVNLYKLFGTDGREVYATVSHESAHQKKRVIVNPRDPLDTGEAGELSVHKIITISGKDMKMIMDDLIADSPPHVAITHLSEYTIANYYVIDVRASKELSALTMRLRYRALGDKGVFEFVVNGDHKSRLAGEECRKLFQRIIDKLEK